MDLLIYVIVMLIFSIGGAFFIESAVNNYKNQHYFMFGLDIMMAIYDAAYIVKLIFNH